MFVPKLFEVTDSAEIFEFMRQNSFALVVSNSGNRPVATHIPLTLESEKNGNVLFGHIARANPQWKSFTDQEQVLAIFQGPHAYISSSWYDHVNAPTWNYIAVHIYGKIRIIEGEELFRSMKKMVNKYEVNSKNPVRLENMESEYVEKNFRAIVGFKISVDEIQAACKLSQNRDDKNYKRVIDELENLNESNSNAIAKEMKKRRKI